MARAVNWMEPPYSARRSLGEIRKKGKVGLGSGVGGSSMILHLSHGIEMDSNSSSMCSSYLQIASKYQSRIMPFQSETFSHFLALSYALYIRSSLTTSTCVDLDALPAAFDSSHEYLPASASPAAAMFT